MRLPLTFAAVASLATIATPALAHDHRDEGIPAWKADYAPPPPESQAATMMEPQAREAWLADCRHRLGSRDRGVGGAVIGGVVGGLAGSRIAGRGDRTEGAIAGAAVGAIAGAVIDKAEDSGRNRDECEAYLDDYYAQYRAPNGQPYVQGPGYGYGYGNGYPAYGYSAGPCCTQQPMMMVPVMMVPVGKPECTETVEYVTEYVPVRTPAKRIIRDKRIKVVPDKRIKLK